MPRHGSFARLCAWTLPVGVLVLAFAVPSAQVQTRGQEGRIGLVRDWSMRHAVFARIGSPAGIFSAARDPRAFQAWRSAGLAMARMERSSNPGENEEPLFLLRGSPPFRHVPKAKVHTDWSINLGGAGTDTGMSSAKFTFDINATPDCTNDFVVYPVDQSPNSTHENLVAFKNLYSGTVPANGICNRTASASDAGTAATVLWSYGIQSADNAGVMTSPVLSLDGTKVAFVTSKSGQQPRFHVLAWKSGDGVNASNLQDPSNSTVVITSFSATAPTAGSGAVTDLAFGASSGGPGDTFSSPFIDYGHDLAYVGDDKGNLVRIKNVFCPSPSNSCAGAAPSIDTSWGSSGTVVVGSGSCSGTGNSKLTAPVADFNTGNVFVGCADGNLYGFNSSGTALATPSVVVGNATATGGLVDSPIVDGTNGFVYAFAGDSSSGHAVAVQTKTDLTSAITNTGLGKGGVGVVHAGAFDDGYFSSATSTNWFLYAQGFNGGGTQTFLYAIGFTAARAMNTTTSFNTNTHPTATQSSPITEFLSGGTDRLFFGLPAGNALDAYNVTTPSTPAQTGSVTEQGGTSAIVVDNAVGGSQFTITATGAVRSSNVVTITMTATPSPAFSPGQVVTISGVTDNSFNGTFTIASVPTTTTFTYAETAANGSSGNGTVCLECQSASVYFSTLSNQACGAGPAGSLNGRCAVKLTQSGLQ